MTTNPFEAVVRTSSHLEGLLRARGATGHGLIDLARSIEQDLPPEVLAELRRIGRIRNRVIHESVPLSDEELRTFLTGAQRVDAALRTPTATPGTSPTWAAPTAAPRPLRPAQLALGILTVSALVLGLGLTQQDIPELPRPPLHFSLSLLATLGLLGGVTYGADALMRRFQVRGGVLLVRVLYAVLGGMLAMMALFATGGRMAVLALLFLPVFALILYLLYAAPLPRVRRAA